MARIEKQQTILMLRTAQLTRNLQNLASAQILNNKVFQLVINSVQS
jgi:hypothetical protein